MLNADVRLGKDGNVQGMYTISEMARMFDLSRQTLIYYDRIGLFKPARVNDEGYRFYAPVQIPQLRLICLLREMDVELKDIAELLNSGDTARIVAHLEEREGELRCRIAELERTLGLIDQRKRFYAEAAAWQKLEGRLQLRQYGERHVVFEPWGVGADEMRRELLHPALMRAIQRLRMPEPTAPVAGWGTMVPLATRPGEDVLAGAGSFVTVPDDVDHTRIGGVLTLPSGVYLCQSRWGMPYDPAGIRAMREAIEVHGFRPVGDAFDFCLLDATSYDEQHEEDFCCMQVMVEL